MECFLHGGSLLVDSLIHTALLLSFLPMDRLTVIYPLDQCLIRLDRSLHIHVYAVYVCFFV